jgi:hypothetical protein
MTTWNHRYVQYARARGKSPEAMLEADDSTWSGGRMTGYILWNSARLEEFFKEQPDAFMIEGRGRRGALVDQVAYDAWLVRRVDEMIALGVNALGVNEVIAMAAGETKTP